MWIPSEMLYSPGSIVMPTFINADSDTFRNFFSVVILVDDDSTPSLYQVSLFFLVNFEKVSHFCLNNKSPCTIKNMKKTGMQAGHFAEVSIENA